MRDKLCWFRNKAGDSRRENVMSKMGGRKIPFRILETALAIFLMAVYVNCEGAAGVESDTCQCGVFLLGSPPLKFSADAKPVLSGLPVAANCSASEDKISCATICRQLIQAMSDSHENSPLVQTVVLAATRTLACQRFNESHKLPVPRIVDGTSHQTTIAKLDEGKKSWKFFVGPLARRETEGEEEAMRLGSAGSDGEEENPLANLSAPKWLGGFYRWCDSHWVYAGVSLQEPLCCLKHLPKKCPTSRSETGNENPGLSANKEGEASNRRGRLIIKKRPEDDLSSEEEDLQTVDDKAEASSTESKDKVPPTVSSFSDTSSETEGPLGNSSMETEIVNPFDDFEDEQNPPKRKPLNSTVLAETFQFMGALMKSMGYGEVADGIAHVLPSSTASQLLERVDVGGWVGTYQDRYVAWPREFSLGYCYLEYSLFNVANEGILATTTNLLSRFFKTNQGPMPPQQQHQNNLNFKMSNYITPMSSMVDGFQSTFHGSNMNIVPGNRRVRRANSDPNVSVSRSYTSIAGDRPRARMATPNRSSLEKLASIARVETAKPSINGNGPIPAPAPAIDRRFIQPGASPSSANKVTNVSANGGSRSQNPQGQRPRKQQDKSHNQSQSKSRPSGKDASTGQLINLASALMQTAMGGPEVDKVSLLMNSAIPALGQVATNPMVQNMVSNIVTSFLTPPRPPVKGGNNGQGPSGSGPSGGSGSDSTGPSGPARKPTQKPLESNEISEPVATSSNSRPSLSSPSGSAPSGGSNSGASNPLAALLGGSGPSGGSGGGGGMLPNLLSQIVQTYVKHYFSKLDSKPPPSKVTQNTKPQKVGGGSIASSSSSSSSSSTNDIDGKPEGDGDIVTTICDVAKPFFMSYFGVVPGHPGFGQLSVYEHKRKDQVDKDSSIYLDRDPDPGMGITEILAGSSSMPETGNPVFDFGNRVAYAFSRANDPQQGLYCFKQYTVNKMWDYFRVGVRTIFK